MLKILKIVIFPVLFLTGMNVFSSTQNNLAFLQYTGEYWQVFVKRSGAKENMVTTNKYDKSAISWFADGVHLFVCGIQGQAEIINTITGMSERVRLPKNNINDAVISPDGNKIVYSYIDYGSINNKLWLYDRKKNTNTALFSDMPGRQYDPKWDINGVYLYFVTGVENTHYEIHKTLMHSKQSIPVIVNSKYNLDVAISKSNKKAYSSNREGGFDIWVKDKGISERLTKIKGSESRPSWSRDETLVYFEKMSDGIIDIWSVRYPQGDLVQITFSESGARYPVLFNEVTH